MLRLTRALFNRMLRVEPVPALEDNYMYLVYDTRSNVGFAVDPVAPTKIRDLAKEKQVHIAEWVRSLHREVYS